MKKSELVTKLSKNQNRLGKSPPKMVDIDLTSVKIEGSNVGSDVNIKSRHQDEGSKGDDQLLTDEAGDLDWADTIEGDKATPKNSNQIGDAINETLYQ